MPLSAGQTLGPYEILASVGAGGMGEVWRARDTRLNRVVAIKTFATQFGDRFDREARAVAALNHPRICQLYDIGPDYLVMEYIDGTPLAGPLPVAKALQYGSEILDALDCAHRHGIVHRDLKPANVLVTKAGIKLLDFGLAKPISAAAAVEALTTLHTAEHTIVGTLGYMAPEQLQAKEADSRTEIFAFGCVLYEMLTGKRAFAGSDHASLIASVLKDDVAPPSTVMPGATNTIPPALDAVVTACLAKEPDERWQTARDLKRELIRIAHEATPAGAERGTPAGRRRERIWMAVAAAAAIAAGVLGTAYVRRGAAPEFAVRASIPPPDDGAVFVTHPNFGGLALSPDGRQLVFGAESNGKQSLFVRDLSSAETRAVPGTENAGKPFWSPDGRSIAFFASPGGVKRVDLAGGNPVTLAGAGPRGGTWNRDGTILFTNALSDGKPQGVFRVPAAGGEAERVTTLDAASGENSHYWPQFLPDGRHFLFLSRNAQPEKSGIYVGSLDDAPAQSKRVRLVTSSFGASFVPSPRGASGYLLVVDGTTLFAHRFDPDLLKVEGERVPLAQDVSAVETNGAVDVAVSADGKLVYGTGAGYKQRLVWRDRSGKPRDAAPNPDQYLDFQLDPDGRRALATIVSGTNRAGVDIYILDFVRGGKTLVVHEPLGFFSAIWSPDGREIIYDTPDGVFKAAANGAGTAERLLEGGEPKNWARDGRLIYESTGTTKKTGLWILPLAGDRKPYPYLQPDANVRAGESSPDGRWIAYTSDETGRREVFVQSFPAGAGKWQVSQDGGARPRWREDGKELLYVATGQRMLKLMAADVTASRSGLDIAAARALFEWPATNNFPLGVADNGQRFLVLEPAARSYRPLTLLLHWQDQLSR